VFIEQDALDRQDPGKSGWASSIIMMALTFATFCGGIYAFFCD
jgi:hypothetical protein